MKRKLRIGIRLNNWLFRNAGIFIIDVPFQSGFAIIETMKQVKELIMPHNPELANALVCEWKEL